MQWPSTLICVMQMCPSAPAVSAAMLACTFHRRASARPRSAHCTSTWHMQFHTVNRLRWFVQWRRMGKTQCVVDNHIRTEFWHLGD